MTISLKPANLKYFASVKQDWKVFQSYSLCNVWQILQFYDCLMTIHDDFLTSQIVHEIVPNIVLKNDFKIISDIVPIIVLEIVPKDDIRGVFVLFPN